MDNHTQESASEGRKSAVVSRRLWASFAIVALGLAGCATAVRSDRDIVAERAQERWNLLLKNDFAAAHGYISPAGRELVTPEAYASSLRKDFWTGAKVGDVVCKQPDACEVDVWVEYQHMGRPMRTPVHEKWIKQRFNWWFVLER
jgi:hypothetical protein